MRLLPPSFMAFSSSLLPRSMFWVAATACKTGTRRALFSERQQDSACAGCRSGITSEGTAAEACKSTSRQGRT